MAWCDWLIFFIRTLTFHPILCDFYFDDQIRQIWWMYECLRMFFSLSSVMCSTFINSKNTIDPFFPKISPHKNEQTYSYKKNSYKKMTHTLASSFRSKSASEYFKDAGGIDRGVKYAPLLTYFVELKAFLRYTRFPMFPMQEFYHFYSSLIVHPFFLAK